MGHFIARRKTEAWLLVAAAILILIAGGAWRLASVAAPALSASEDRLAKLHEMSTGGLLAEDSTALADIRHHLAEVRSQIEATGGLMRWVGGFAAATSWLPPADQELAAWSDQVARVRKDLEAASILLESSTLLLDTYPDAEAAILSPGASAGLLRAQMEELERTFESSLAMVSEARRAGRAFGVGLQAPRIRGVTGPLADIEERVMTGSEVGREASGLLAGLLGLAEGARPLFSQFAIDGARAQPISTDDVRAILANMSTDVASANDKAESVVSLVSRADEGEWLLEKLSRLQQVLEVLGTITRAATTALDAVAPTAKLLETAEGGILNNGGRLGELLGSFAGMAAETGDVIGDLEDAERVLAELRSSDPAFGGRLDDMSDVVRDLRAGLNLAASMAPLGDRLLGSEGTRRYLLMGQSADELRGTGGFVSSIWLITFEDGELINVKYNDAVRVDDWGRIALYPKAPPGLDEHMNAWVWLLRDVSWDPDFPTTARTAEDMFNLGQRQQVDGVIAFNQWTLLRLLEALGSIPAPAGEPVTQRNLLSVLEEGTDQHGRAYMDLVLQGLLDRLSGPMSLPQLTRLASGISDTLRERDTLVFLNDPDLHRVISETGWDGSIVDGTADYLYVVDSNVGWSKADRNIERDAHYLVDLSRGRQPRISLTLGYNNHSGPASSACEPQWLFRGTNYSQQKNACYWNFVRVYIPEGTRLLSSTRLPLPEYSVSVEIGRGVPGQDTGRVSSRATARWYSRG